MYCLIVSFICLMHELCALWGPLFIIRCHINIGLLGLQMMQSAIGRSWCKGGLVLLSTLLELAMTESQRCSGTCQSQYSTERKTISRVNRNLGVHEAEGVLEAIRHLALTVRDIDGNKIGLHGHSYGGFLTLATMTSQMVG